MDTSKLRAAKANKPQTPRFTSCPGMGPGPWVAFARSNRAKSSWTLPAESIRMGSMASHANQCGFAPRKWLEAPMQYVVGQARPYDSSNLPKPDFSRRGSKSGVSARKEVLCVEFVLLNRRAKSKILYRLHLAPSGGEGFQQAACCQS